MADLEAGQQTELDRLPGQPIGAGDDRLAGDDGRRRREHDHRQQRPIGGEQEERIFERLGLLQHQCALAEVIHGERR